MSRFEIKEVLDDIVELYDTNTLIGQFRNDSQIKRVVIILNSLDEEKNKLWNELIESKEVIDSLTKDNYHKLEINKHLIKRTKHLKEHLLEAQDEGYNLNKEELLCENCKHLTRIMNSQTGKYYCSYHKQDVDKSSICERHTGIIGGVL